MRTIYTLLLRLLTPLVLLRLGWKGMKNRDYWHRWPQRFGYFSAPPLRQPLWLHAVSVGEFQAAIPFIRKLLQDQPQHSIVVTTTTPTGSSRVSSTFGEQVFHVYLPYDLPGAVNRFLDAVQPRLALVMETEIWPNLYHACHRRGIPICVANARLSIHSMQGYQRLRRLTAQTLGYIDCIAAQSETDRQRFLTLGAAADRLRVMGNIKFDLELPAPQLTAGDALRAQFGQRFVWIAGSTHEGEEIQVLEAHRAIGLSLQRPLLILVPRHPERSNHVATLCQRQGFRVARRSRREAVDAAIDIYLGDTLGEMLTLYRAADLAFVGGSLVPVGGHNLLEPAALGLPVLSGPHLFNFLEISQALSKAAALRKVENPPQLAKIVLQLAADAGARQRMGDAGRTLVSDNRGALQRLCEETRRLLAPGENGRE